MTVTESLTEDQLGQLEAGPAEEFTTPVGAPTCVAPGIPRLTPYIPYVPRPKQRLFLMLRTLEAFYGGAAGGGKSDGLLMAALQFVDVPNYSAILLRKTYQDLKLPGALMHRADAWLKDRTDARWSAAEKAWYFPSGAQLTFGYCENDKDVMRYRSAEFQYIGIDESTQWSEFAYRYLFSRLRKPDHGAAGLEPSQQDGMTLAQVPLRMRSGSNPGDVGHPWVKRRLVDAETRVAPFIPAKSADLEGIINVEAYLRSLREMDPVNWMRYAYGDWEIRDPGEIFDASKLEPVEHPFSDTARRVRYWDMASTEARTGNDPDWTVGLRLALEPATGKWCIEHVVRVRREPDEIERIMLQTAEMDGRRVPIRVEQEPGSEGKAYVSYLRRHLLRGYNIDGDPASGKGPKPARIRMMQPLVNNGDVCIMLAPWTQAFIDELDAWPNVEHDDQADAFAGAHRMLTMGGGRVIV